MATVWTLIPELSVNGLTSSSKWAELSPMTQTVSSLGLAALALPEPEHPASARRLTAAADATQLRRGLFIAVPFGRMFTVLSCRQRCGGVSPEASGAAAVNI
jgi:hypothetical protein